MDVFRSATTLGITPSGPRKSLSGSVHLKLVNSGDAAYHEALVNCSIFSSKARLLSCGVSDTREDELFTRQDIKIISSMMTFLLCRHGWEARRR
jgi:hypothetical protein